jgi:uncharacterized protein HemX
MAIDLTALGTAIGAIGTVSAGVWAWVVLQRTKRADTRADVAQSDAARTVADSQRLVYTQMSDRMTAMEGDIKELRAELAEERKHSRALEQKLAALMAWIRAQGLTPPPL